MNLDRRDFLRVVLAGGAAALIPKVLLAGKPTDTGSTAIFIENARIGDEIRILQVTPGKGPTAAPVMTEVFRMTVPEGAGVTDKGLAPIEIDAPLKWGEIRVHLIQRTEGDFSIVGPNNIPMSVEIHTARTSEIEHDRMPDGEPTKRKNTISINGVETELDDRWDVIMPGEPLVPGRKT